MEAKPTTLTLGGPLQSKVTSEGKNPHCVHTTVISGWKSFENGALVCTNCLAFDILIIEHSMKNHSDILSFKDVVFTKRYKGS